MQDLIRAVARFEAAERSIADVVQKWLWSPDHRRLLERRRIAIQAAEVVRACAVDLLYDSCSDEYHLLREAAHGEENVPAHGGDALIALARKIAKVVRRAAEGRDVGEEAFAGDRTSA